MYAIECVLLLSVCCMYLQTGMILRNLTVWKFGVCVYRDCYYVKGWEVDSLSAVHIQFDVFGTRCSRIKWDWGRSVLSSILPRYGLQHINLLAWGRVPKEGRKSSVTFLLHIWKERGARNQGQIKKRKFNFFNRKSDFVIQLTYI